MAINELTDARYYGKICEKHPEFRGLRNRKTYKCVECHSEGRGKKPTRPPARAVLEMEIGKTKMRIDELSKMRNDLLAKLSEQYAVLNSLEPT